MIFKIIRIFELSVKTIRGKINLGFISLCIAMLMVMVFLLGQSRSIIKQYEYYLNIIKPLTVFSYKLNEAASRSFGEIASYNNSQKASHFLQAQQTLQVEALANLDTLHKLAAASNNAKIKQKTMLLLSSYPKLLETMNRLYDLKDADKQAFIEKEVMASIKNTRGYTVELVMECDVIEHQFKMNELAKGKSILVTGALLVSLILGIGMGVTYFITSSVVSKINEYSAYLRTLLQGKLLQKELYSEDEFQEIAISLNDLNQELINVRQFATEVGSGKFDTDVSVFHNSGELGEALEGMRDSLKDVSDKEAVHKWHVHGVSEVSDIIRKNHGNIEELCDSVLTCIVSHIEINQGAVYVLDEEKNSLEAKAVYAWGRKKFIHQTLNVGEGLTGQAFLDGVTQHLQEVPADYVRIKAGMGEALPRSIIMIPLKYQKKKIGIMEFASFNTWKNQEIKLFEEIAEIIAVDIINKLANEKTKVLLKEAQEYAERLNAQEEELRQNMEELTATQEEMERGIREQGK